MTQAMDTMNPFLVTIAHWHINALQASPFTAPHASCCNHMLTHLLVIWLAFPSVSILLQLLKLHTCRGRSRPGCLPAQKGNSR